MTGQLGRRAFLTAAGTAMTVASTASLAVIRRPTESLLLLADSPASGGWLQAVSNAFTAHTGHPAEVVIAARGDHAMARIADHLARPRGAFLSLLTSASHLLVHMALRDAGAHQHLELERAGDLLRGPLPSLQLHRTLGFPLVRPTPATLAHRSLLAGAMEFSR